MRSFKLRRQNVLKYLGSNQALLLPSLPEFFRQPDVAYPYRQDSYLYYLTGFEEPDSLLLIKKAPKEKSILFVRDKDALKELWDGPRFGPLEAKKHFKIEEVYPISQWKEKVKEELQDVACLFYNDIDPKVTKEIQWLDKEIRPAKELLAPLRKIKSSTEIENLKEACEVTAYAHKKLAQSLRPNLTERALHGVFIQAIMEKGSPREGYQSIIASGNQATTLHYVSKDKTCLKGELLLVDAGAEINYYTADVTRVYPVTGRFSKEQKILYENLLHLQKNLIKEVRPDSSMQMLQDKMKTGMTELLLEVKILKGTLREHLEKDSYKTYCPHFIGHLLGMDVHDPNVVSRKTTILQSSMVITIEPGIYIPHNFKEAPACFRGIGLRIEDDILVTSKGYENLTHEIPKEIQEIEELCSLN